MLRPTLLFLSAFCLGSCAFHSAPSIVKIRSLGEPLPVMQSNGSNGRIDGLERVSLDRSGKIQANVLIVHGMGWSQMATPDDRFGFDFIEAAEAAYGVRGTAKNITRLCPQFTNEGRRDERYMPGGLMILAEPDAPSLQTDAPGTRLKIRDLACLDRIVLI